MNIETKLQQISDVAWIVQRGTHRMGILNKDVQNHYTFISGKSIEVFGSDDEVRNHFGNIRLFEDKLDQELIRKDGVYIRGHLVDYLDPVLVEETDPNYRHDLPLYLKSVGSDVYYAAGWYCINFERGWKQAHSPKLSTLLQYGFTGPFRTNSESREEMKRLNRNRRNNAT
jgi:hypothetical protein